MTCGTMMCCIFTALCISCGEVDRVVDVDLQGAMPGYVSYRNLGGEWKHPTLKNGLYEISIAGKYQFLTVCTSRDLGGNLLVYSELLEATSADGARIDAGYGCSLAPSSASQRVFGTMLQPGSVSMTQTAASSTAPWDFDLVASVGTHDLVAVTEGAAPKVLVRRQQLISAGMPTDEGSLDVMGDGTAMVPINPSVMGASPEEQVTASVTLRTATDSAVIWSSNGQVANPASFGAQSMPGELLQNGDEQILDVAALATESTQPVLQESERSSQVILDNGSAVTLPVTPVVTFSVQDGTAIANWSWPTDFDDLEFQIGTGCPSAPCNGTKVSERVIATSNFIDSANGVLSFLGTPPYGTLFPRIDLNGPIEQWVRIDGRTADESYQSSLLQIE